MTFWESQDGHKHVLIHGDLNVKNIIVNNGKIVGFLDFECLSIGDAMLDFVPLPHCGPHFANEVLQQYSRLGGSLGGNLKGNSQDNRTLEEYKSRIYSLYAFADIYITMKTGCINTDTLEQILYPIRETIINPYKARTSEKETDEHPDKTGMKHHGREERQFGGCKGWNNYPNKHQVVEEI